MYFDEILESLFKNNIVNKTNILGCSEKEISYLEDSIGFKLPVLYRNFLLNLGKEAGLLFKGEEFFYNYIYANNLRMKAINILNENSVSQLPVNAFVFGITYNSEFWYIIPNAPDYVYYYSNKYKYTNHNYPFIHYSSLYEFFYSMVFFYSQKNSEALKYSFRIQKKEYDKKMIIDIKNKMVNYQFNIRPFIGVSENKILELEIVLGEKLPNLYKDFLLNFGISSGSLFAGGCYNYDYVLSNAINSRNSNDDDLYEIVVFYNLDAYFYIDLYDCDDNPPVYIVINGDKNKKKIRYTTLYQFYMGIMDSIKGYKNLI